MDIFNSWKFNHCVFSDQSELIDEIDEIEERNNVINAAITQNNCNHQQCKMNDSNLYMTSDAYGEFYNSAQMNLVSGNSIYFSNLLRIKNMEFGSNNSDIRILEKGNYRIFYKLKSPIPSDAILCLKLNDIIVENSISDSSIDKRIKVGRTILELEQGAILKLSLIYSRLELANETNAIISVVKMC